jgi:hypothetical protein
VPALLLIALAGLLACVFVPMLVGGGSMWKRAATGLAWAVADFAAWVGLMFLVSRLDLPQAVGYAPIGFLALFPWILPAALFIAGRRGRL